MKKLFATLLVLAWGSSLAIGASSHADYFEHYEGTKTCLQCHEKEAEAFFHSQHYQWEGPAPNISNANGRRLGKMNTINDFCTNPAANWIGEVKNSHGDVISRGCSACHAGLGLKPEEKLTRAQLENIDCLQCHASGYRRDIYPTPNGGWQWKPILWQNQEGLDSVSKRISLPTRTMCLRCHSASGGGPNYKRGDLEYAMADTTIDYDVHMASEGANLQCIGCHRGEDHRIKGRGSDLSGTDVGRISCEDCHKSSPHVSADLNRHVARVNCTVCHIPSFARTDPTDMVRDWSKPSYHPETDKYSATITLEKDVKPVYAWFNGNTHEQLLKEPIVRAEDGTVGMMLPEGSRDDKSARIYAFKLHRGRLPVLKDKNWIVPIQVEEFFQKGELDKSVASAAFAQYGIKDAKIYWVDTTRYMGIFHGVQPASQALKCIDCHGPNGRLDWVALGYQKNPHPLETKD
jgi:hypothetical protein